MQGQTPLHEVINAVEGFMNDTLKLTIQKGKTVICPMWQGVEFLGAYIKPYRTYISNQCLRRIHQKTDTYRKKNLLNNPINSINSYLGIFSHYKSYKLRTEWFCHLYGLFQYGAFNRQMTKFIPLEKWNAPSA